MHLSGIIYSSLLSVILIACGGGGSGNTGTNNTSTFTTSQRNLCALSITDRQNHYALTSRHVSFPLGPGKGGYSTFDTDNDGYPEIVIGSGTEFIIIEYNQNSNTYETLCQSKQYSNLIKQIVPINNNSLNHASALILKNGDVEIIDHMTGTTVRTISTNMSNINDALVADADNDGQEEIVILSDTELGFINSDSYAFEGTITIGGKEMAVGNFTRTDALQTAINNGVVLDIDNNTATIAWDYRNVGFGFKYVTAGDIDGDGLDEIIGGDLRSNIYAYNADTRSLFWQFTALGTISTVDVFDTDGNNNPEVLYSDEAGGSIHILDGVTSNRLFTYSNPAPGVPSLLVGDFDNDSQLELIWGSGSFSTGEDYIRVVDLSTQQVEWTSTATESPTLSVAFSDLNGDNIPESIFASINSSAFFEGGIVTAIDNTTDSILWRTGPNTLNTAIRSLTVADLNEDGSKEVILGAPSSLLRTKLSALSPITGNPVATLTLNSNIDINSLKVADIDGDGQEEILAGGDKTNIQNSGNQIYIIDPLTFTLNKVLPSLNNSNSGLSLYSLNTVDWDGDQYLDIIALRDNAYVIDHEINAFLETTTNTFTASTVTGTDVYLASGNSVYQLFSDATTSVIGSTECTGNIKALEAIDSNQLAFTCDGRLGVYQISTSTTTWQTGFLDNNLGLLDSMQHVILNGTSTLLVGGDVAYQFKLQ